MNRTRFAALVALACLPAAALLLVADDPPAPDAPAPIKVQPDRQNVVASRLIGDWVAEPKLTQRLTGGKVDRESPRGAISFAENADIAATIPAKYHVAFNGRTIFLAGTITFAGQTHPFVLTVFSGNPHVVWFRRRGDEPLGDAESFNVMLARADDPADDLLFVGGDFNNQPFAAFERVRSAAPTTQPDEPLDAAALAKKFLHAIYFGDARELDSVIMANPDARLLLQKKPVTETEIGAARLLVANATIRELKVGDLLDLPDGRKMPVGKSLVNERTRLLLVHMPRVGDSPLLLRKIAGRWLVDANPMIEAARADRDDSTGDAP